MYSTNAPSSQPTHMDTMFMSCMAAFQKSGSHDSTEQGVMSSQELAALLRGLCAHRLQIGLLACVTSQDQTQAEARH